ncbi:MAG: amidohydrolase [Clostridia bacterium]|nr:amidohydrolase [Clostridia bacterium]
MTYNIKLMAEQLQEETVFIRRQLHKIAELSFCEFKTSEFIKNYLLDLGLLVKTNVYKTGVVGFLDAGKENTLLIRADMDALPILEENNLPYKSENEGVMHACGHDAHMAVVLSSAKLLTKIKDALSSNILFVFQPGEETDGGADPMIKTGLLEEFSVKGAVGLHVMNDVPIGKILLKSGALMASPDDFDLYVHGRGGHGAYPEKCLNPIYVASEIIHSLEKQMSLVSFPDSKVVFSVCSVNAGSRYNIIPDTVHIRGTARSFSDETRKRISYMMEEEIKKVCSSFGAEYDFKFNFRYPPLINDEKCVELMAKTVSDIYGAESIVWAKEPSMAGEDFSYFAKEVPSVYFYLGSENKEKGAVAPLHSPDFIIDEDCLKIGVSSIVSYAVNFS